jgi:hypothetical protein
MKKRKPNPNSHPHIVRIDHKSTHGYQVRVPLRPKPMSKFFADGKYSSKAKALKEARSWRDSMFNKHDLPLSATRRIRYSNSRNSTGVLGVGMQWVTKGGYQYKHYVVTWCPEPYKQRNKLFSAHKFGDQKAFDMAVKFRKEKEQEIRTRG